MAEIDKSSKLIFNEFQRAISEVPLEVYYQTITSDQYSENGFQFNIKQPGVNALLDCDIWMKYTFLVQDTAYYIQDSLQDHNGAGDPGLSAPLFNPPHRFAFRGGNVAARCLQNLSVQINNTTLNVQPYKYMDVLNRLYVSNDQSEHEFSASGGRFDEGNHGNRTDSVMYEAQTAIGLPWADGGTMAPDAALALAAAPNNFNLQGITWSNSIINQRLRAEAHAQAAVCNLRPPFPMKYEWYNPGFSRRVDKFAYKCRAEAFRAVGAADTGAANPSALVGARFTGTEVVAGNNYWTFVIYERLPIPLFKMYSSDGNYGVIPNITQMQIQGNFLTNMAVNMIRIDDNAATTANSISLLWGNYISSSLGELYLRWYTPPMNMSVPRELSIPYPKINTWSVSQTLTATNANVNNAVSDNQVSHYNITIEAIPDLLLIYVKFSAAAYTFSTPDDYLLELLNLNINIDNASGKVNQIKTIDLYQKWKKIIKHQDAKIIGYDEWRKYCCVAALQPEDYGVRYGPGYSNQTTLGVSVTARNWHINPNTLGTAPAEPLGGNAGAGTAGELIITTIYNKNRLIIRADGSAAQELTKIAADFNMLTPMSAPQAMPGVTRLL